MASIGQVWVGRRGGGLVGYIYRSIVNPRSAAWHGPLKSFVKLNYQKLQIAWIMRCSRTWNQREKERER